MAEDIATRVAAPSTGTMREIFLGVLWLGTSMWTAHATITGSGGDVSGALGAAAAALPGAIAATLVTSAGIGHAAGGRFDSAGARLLAGLGLGALFGLITAVGIRFGYGSASSITVLAVTVGVAAVLGGALAVLPDLVLEAGLWATSWTFFAGVIFGVLQPQLVALLGGGPDASVAAQATADTRFTYGQSVATGLLVAYFALQQLRREPRGRGWFPVVGALPGLVLLAAEGLSRVGGSSVNHLLHGIAVDQGALVQLTDAARVRHGFIVLVVGTIAMTLAALPSRPE